MLRFLYAVNENLAHFIDSEILDIIVWELYFHDLLDESGIYSDSKPQLRHAIAEIIPNINYEQISEYYWKVLTGAELSSDEKKKKVSTEKSIVLSIKEFQDRVLSDDSINSSFQRTFFRAEICGS